MYDVFKPQQPVGLIDFVKAAKSCVSEIGPDELQRMKQEKPDLLILDVRESSEHEQGHIEGAHLVPRGILEAAADPAFPNHDEILAAARNRPVVTYCATGGRSAMAAAVLQMMGFAEVYSLVGGFGGWSQAGKPVVHEARYV
ncbi:rhodanese-like domain-containing protein [Acidihalobacter prosperus]|uniref:Sulfurtransferase n=1 Tax=Acidihalobacter prosperus TaxID=160660 RepID=A0A1A6C1Y9_9GAMM|nr:rhodanese-like domain-containing protein [Acidihalobacter prosperus]OBS08565.1 sulfurtransferase [Acidihalobacter prosperus]